MKATEGLGVSVVMVSFNTGPILWRSIESVLAQPNLKELIIVDNGNALRYVERLQQLAKTEPKLVLISGHGNIGFAKGCNMGTTRAKGDYLLLLNPDCILPNAVLNRFIDVMQAYPEAWVAGCCIMNPNHTEQSGSRRHLLTPRMAIVEGLRLYRFKGQEAAFERMNFHDTPKPDQPVEVPAISGACMMMKREIYQTIGGLDERYFFHVEDLDFCLQVHRLGGKILYIPSIHIVHYRSSSQVSDWYVEYNKAKGFVQYFHKNFVRDVFPVVLWLLTLGSYVRFICRSSMIYARKLLRRISFKQRGSTYSRDELIYHFLKSYDQVDDHVYKAGLVSTDIEPVMLLGASGQVGLAILRRLLAANIQTTACYFTHVIDGEHPKLRWQHMDIAHPRFIQCTGEEHTIITTCPIWYVPGYLSLLPENHQVKRIISFGSTSVFAKASSSNSYERELVKKFQWAEQEIKRHCEAKAIEWIIIRPTLIYGIGLDRNVTRISHFIKRFHIFPVVGAASGRRAPVHVDDLAIAVMQLLANPSIANQAFNLCGGEVLTYHTMVERIFNALDIRPCYMPLPMMPYLMDLYGKLMRKSDVNGEMARRMNSDLVFDDSAARQAFGYNPRGFLADKQNDLEPKF